MAIYSLQNKDIVLKNKINNHINAIKTDHKTYYNLNKSTKKTT